MTRKITLIRQAKVVSEVSASIVLLRHAGSATARSQVAFQIISQNSSGSIFSG